MFGELPAHDNHVQGNWQQTCMLYVHVQTNMLHYGSIITRQLGILSHPAAGGSLQDANLRGVYGVADAAGRVVIHGQ
jgi:hypothetical protein